MSEVSFVVTNSIRENIYDGNGGYWRKGVNISTITFSSSGTTFNSSTQMLPAASIIEAVTAYVVTSIGTTSSSVSTAFQLGDGTTVARFGTATSSQVAITSTLVGLTHIDQSSNAGPRQTNAANLVVTTPVIPMSGQLHVSVFYRGFAPPSA